MSLLRASKANKIVINNSELWLSEFAPSNEVNKGGLAPSKVFTSKVFIKDGVWQEGEGSHSDALVIDGSDCVLIPAGVDPQVHLRVPGQSQKETAQTGLQASVSGGVAALLTMPNTKPVIDDADSFHLAKEELLQAQKIYPVEVLISAAISKSQKGKEPVDFASLAKLGVAAFTDDGVGVVSDEIMKSAFKASADFNLPILQHAEVPGHGAVLAEGPIQQQLNLKPYPASAEYEMVARDLKLLKDFPEARYHVLHISSSKTLDLIKQAKDQNLNVTCEVSPHHLFFSSDDIDIHNTSFKMNPPLRSQQDRLSLLKGLANGDIDFVATDHAPHEPETKTQNFKTSAFGTTGLETSLRVLLELVRLGELSKTRMVEVFSTAPAKFLGINNRFGTLQKNKEFYGVLIQSPNTEFAVQTNDLYSLSKNNCFLGAKLAGKIKAVIIKDQVFLNS